jgi:hypothetical protein
MTKDDFAPVQGQDEGRRKLGFDLSPKKTPS